MGLGAGSGVLMHDARLHGLVHGGDVRDRGSLGGGGVIRGDGGIQLLVESLQAGFDASITDGETNRFARGFDGGFGVGHGQSEELSRSKTQTRRGESRANSVNRGGWFERLARQPCSLLKSTDGYSVVPQLISLTAMKTISLACLSLCFLAGCVNPAARKDKAFYNYTYHSITKGMTKEEIIQRVGRPDWTDKYGLLHWKQSWVSGDSGNYVELVVDLDADDTVARAKVNSGSEEYPKPSDLPR